MIAPTMISRVVLKVARVFRVATRAESLEFPPRSRRLVAVRSPALQHATPLETKPRVLASVLLEAQA